MKRVFLLIFIVSAAAGGWFYYDNVLNNKKEGLTFYGNVENRTQNLSFPFLGTLQNVNKDEGQAIKKGDILATLDSSPYMYELNNVQAQIKAQEAVLAKLNFGYQKEQIAQAKAALDEAKASLFGAKDTYERQKKLLASKSTSEQNFILAKSSYEKAAASVDKALHNYNLLNEGYRKEDIKTQSEQVAALKAKEQTLLYDINRSTLYAPNKGTILRRYEEPGSVIAPAQSVFEIALQDEYWVRAYIDEPLLGKIKQGEKMLVFTDARKEPYEGYVGFISAVAEFTPKNVETTELRSDLVYRFRVIITDADAKLKQGMPVSVKPRDE